ncbi:hypothetical protein Leryth_020811 [Lithospermum erythrorhizon]|nr:hypothetical protein Leryth_020811 [Lithospermum erythrorhizon]
MSNDITVTLLERNATIITYTEYLSRTDIRMLFICQENLRLLSEGGSFMPEVDGGLSRQKVVKGEYVKGLESREMKS